MWVEEEQERGEKRMKLVCMYLIGDEVVACGSRIARGLVIGGYKMHIYLHGDWAGPCLTLHSCLGIGTERIVSLSEIVAGRWSTAHLERKIGMGIGDIDGAVIDDMCESGKSSVKK